MSIPETVVINVAYHKIVDDIMQENPLYPNVAVKPDGKQVWFILKDTGKTQALNARPRFDILTTIDTGPIRNYVNFAHMPTARLPM